MMAKILVAEDDRHIVRVITLWLTRNGHEVIAAKNGQIALELLREHRPDLLITDVNMGVMDGLELLEAANEESLLCNRSIVLTSRCDQMEIKARVSQLRAEVHPKPFSPLHLTKAIESVLQSSFEGDETELESVAVAGNSDHDK